MKKLRNRNKNTNKKFTFFITYQASRHHLQITAQKNSDSNLDLNKNINCGLNADR